MITWACLGLLITLLIFRSFFRFISRRKPSKRDYKKYDNRKESKSSDHNSKSVNDIFSNAKKSAEAILNTARALQIEQDFLIEDALARLINIPFDPYVVLEILSSFRKELDDDPMFAYCAISIVHYL